MKDYLYKEIHKLGGDAPQPNNRYPYEWSILNNILDNFLKTTGNVEDLKSIFAVMNELGEELSKVKIQNGISDAEVTKLKTIENVESEDKPIRSRFSTSSVSEKENPVTWESRLRLDVSNLQERALNCTEILDKVESKLKNISAKLPFKEFKMAGVKGMERAKVKLRQ